MDPISPNESEFDETKITQPNVACFARTFFIGYKSELLTFALRNQKYPSIYPQKQSTCPINNSLKDNQTRECCNYCSIKLQCFLYDVIHVIVMVEITHIKAVHSLFFYLHKNDMKWTQPDRNIIPN